MKKIKWMKLGFEDPVIAIVGCLTLRCIPHLTRSRKVRWFARAYMTGNMSRSIRTGSDRHSLIKAQEDAIQFACEILLDYKAGLDVELKNFDIMEQEV